MIIKDVVNALNGNVVCGSDLLDQEVEYAFASDLMSDVFTTQTDGMVLITGLANVQAIRTADMSDIGCIVFVRNKKVSHEMIELAQENSMVLVECAYSMFRASGLLFGNGLKPIF